MSAPAVLTISFEELQAAYEQLRSLVAQPDEAATPGPALPAECWNTRPVNTDTAMAAMRAMCQGQVAS